MGQSTFPIPSAGSSTSTILPVNASSVILDGSITSSGNYTTTVNGNGGIAYLTNTATLPATITISGTVYSIPTNSVITSKVFGTSTSVTVAAQLGGSPSSAFTSITMPSTSYWSGFAYGSISGTNYWMAVSQSSNGAYSTNGTTWTATSLAYNYSWINTAYGNSTFVSVQQGAGSATGIYSTNGTSWSPMSMASSTNWDDVTYGNGYFVAIAQSTTAAAYSTNGSTWTASTLPSSKSWDSVTYGNGTFVAVQNSGTTAGAYFAQSTLLPVNFGIYAGPTTIN